MTIASTTARNTYALNGATTVFPYTFRILEAADLEVVSRSATTRLETVLTLNTDYTVSGVGNTSGGAVTLTDAGESGDVLVIRRDAPLTQETSLVNQGRYSPADIEEALDRHTGMLQQLQDQLDRTLRVSSTYAGGLEITDLTAGKALVTTGDGLTLSTLDAGAVAIPGESRTVGSLTAYLANNAVYNLQDYGAVGDGVTDDTAALVAWYAAIPDGALGVIPSGHFRFTSQLDWNKAVHIVGHGSASALMPDLNDATTAAIVVNDSVSPAYLYRVVHEHFAIISDKANCCSTAIVYNRVHGSEINLHIFATAAQYGVQTNGCLETRFRFVGSTNIVWPYAGGAPITGWLLVTKDSPTNIPCNVCEYDVSFAGGAKGIRVTDQDEEGNSWFRGTIQGVTDPIYIENAVGPAISHLHLEGNLGGIEIVNCSRLHIGPAVQLPEADITMTGSDTVSIDGGVQIMNLVLDSNCDRILLGTGFFYGGTVTDPGDKIRWTLASRSAFTASLPTATSTTVVATQTAAGLYRVAAFILGAGANYHAVADFVNDGTTMTRVQGTNGANLTLTALGTDVKATQTSGSNQVIRVVYEFLPYI